MGRSLRPAIDQRESFIAPAGTSDALPHVAVLLPSGPEREALLLALDQDARVTVLEAGSPVTNLEAVDIALLHTDSLGLSASPLLYDPELGCPELVFVVDQAGSPQHLAMKSRGSRYVVSQDALSRWFPGVLSELAALARARRIVLRACADGPNAPELPARGGYPRAVKLHAAETAFRDIFLRSLLAEHGSRRKAAEAAGVPYRSFCEMLRKLGI